MPNPVYIDRLHDPTLDMAANRKHGASLPPPGTVLADRYQLLHPIGEGGMSTVYLAEHIAIGRKLAIKILVPEYRNNREVLDRFFQEARAVSLIRHEHIVDITDIGRTSHGLAFLAMEYLEGEDLSTTLLREGRLRWVRLRRMILQICRALHAAHRMGVVHRDIKPENCFRIKRGGNYDFIKILDFGIAKFVADDSKSRVQRPRIQSGDNVMLGTPEYMAPELARGETPTGSTDVYALGSLMYHALVGRPPFVGESAAEVLSMQLRDEPVRPRLA
ncbi:MAG: serine/threonine-protein kinase, partial [Nannocystaceae bacterium]